MNREQLARKLNELENQVKEVRELLTTIDESEDSRRKAVKGFLQKWD